MLGTHEYQWDRHIWDMRMHLIQRMRPSSQRIRASLTLRSIGKAAVRFQNSLVLHFKFSPSISHVSVLPASGSCRHESIPLGATSQQYIHSGHLRNTTDDHDLCMPVRAAVLLVLIILTDDKPDPDCVDMAAHSH